MITKLLDVKRSFSWLTVVLGGTVGLGSVPSVKADDWGVGVSLAGDGYYVSGGYDRGYARCYDRPVTIYREPVYDVQRVRVIVPSEYGYDRFPRYDRYGTYSGYETVRHVVRPSRTIWRDEYVVTRPSYYETVYDGGYALPRYRSYSYDRSYYRPRYTHLSVGFGHHDHHYRAARFHRGHSDFGHHRHGGVRIRRDR